MKKYDELERKFNQEKEKKKNYIRLEKNKFKKFFKWIWFAISFPFVWLWINIRDWITALIFIIVLILLSIEIWFPYLLGFIFWNNESLRISLFSIGSACWLFWISPGTPFLVICIGLTIAIKGLFNKIKKKKKPKKELNHLDKQK